MVRRLYDWVMAFAVHRHAMWALAGISFIESSIFPVPPDVLLIPMVLAARNRAMTIALVCTVASVLGGMVGYGIGYFFYETAGRDIIAFYGLSHAFEGWRAAYQEWGGWIVAIKGLTPIPYKLVTIASGVFELDLATFTIASVVSRGLRFFVEAALLWYIGPPVRHFVERHLTMVTTVFLVALVGGFVVVSYTF